MEINYTEEDRYIRAQKRVKEIKDFMHISQYMLFVIQL